MEIAVVLVIISVLLAMVAMPLATQLEQRRREDTQKFLEAAKDALYGFAAANGRLPCPATTASAGSESFCTASGVCGAPQAVVQTHGRCFSPIGFLPAVSLGLSPVDAGGYAQDAWADGTNLRRIGYAVSEGPTTNPYALTAPDGIKNATMTPVANSTHLYVCGTGLAVTPPTANCHASVTTLADKAPAVLFSFGKDNAANSFDETNNQNGDKAFSSGTPTPTFDDLVTWMSLNTLFDRMVKAGKLP